MSNVCTGTKMAFSMVLSIINKICTPQTMNAILANQSAINYSINTRHMTWNGLISLTRLLHHLCINICAFTPNCNKVVIEKSKKPNSSVWSRAMISDRFFLFGVRQFLPSTARVQFFSFFFLSKTPWRWEVKSRKFQLAPLTIHGEIAKILSSSIDDSLLAWIGLLDGTRIRTLANLLYLGIRDNHWNYVNFETLETHCN